MLQANKMITTYLLSFWFQCVLIYFASNLVSVTVIYFVTTILLIEIIYKFRIFIIDLLFIPRLAVFLILLIFAINNIKSMHAVSTNEIVDILNYNENNYYKLLNRKLSNGICKLIISFYIVNSFEIFSYNTFNMKNLFIL